MMQVDYQIQNLLNSAELIVKPDYGLPPIEPGPASLDCRLDKVLVRYTESNALLDPLNANKATISRIEIPEEGYILGPGECVLGSTNEYIEVPRDITVRVDGRSSIGRVFLIIHSTAGFIDPGFKGKVTLEIVNLNKNLPVILHAGMRIGQFVFEKHEPCAKSYSERETSKYMHQMEATPSRGVTK